MIWTDHCFAAMQNIRSQYTAVALVLLGSGAAMAAPAAPVCLAASPFPGGLRVINAVRVVKDANGESDFIDVKVPAPTHSYFKPTDLRPGDLFAAVDFGAASRVQVVSAPANVTLPPHASLAYEMFLTIQGSSAVVLPSGKRRDLHPGSLVIMEDMGSKSGHAGEIGPCGSVTIQIVPTVPFARSQP